MHFAHGVHGIAESVTTKPRLDWGGGMSRRLCINLNMELSSPQIFLKLKRRNNSCGQLTYMELEEDLSQTLLRFLHLGLLGGKKEYTL